VSKHARPVPKASHLPKTQILRYAVKPGAPQLDKIDQQAEARLAQKKLGVDPDAVTATSSIRKVLEPKEPVEEDFDMFGSLKADVVCHISTMVIGQVRYGS
jgi:hypothetical protein